MMRPLVFIWVAFVGALALGVLVGFVVLIGVPSEVSTTTLLRLVFEVVALAALIIWLALKLTTHEYQRLGVAGVGLLAVGTAFAVGLLPEHEATGTSRGAIGVLPPAPGSKSVGFQIGLVTQPQGCNESVPIKLVVNGSSEYWSRFRARYHSPPGRGLHFVIVLPGDIRNLRMGLGQPNTIPIDDPQQANIVGDVRVREELRQEPTARPGKRDLTVLSGEVKDWARTRRPVIVTADADWISRRGVNDCTLHLPALSGPPSALVLAEALTCTHLNQSYLRGTCADPPDPAGETASATVSPALEVSEAATMVAGSEISKSESVPQPGEIGETSGWRCRAPRPPSTPKIAGGIEAGSGSTSASIAYQGDCHAIATIVASSWRRDFLIALIGALVAVGIHMMFQSMVDAPGRGRGAGMGAGARD